MISEDFTLIIKSLEEVKSRDLIKDIVIELNTLNSGNASYITDLINGELEAIIIESSSPILFILSIEELSLILFEGNITSSFIALRQQAINRRNEVFNYSQEKIALNNKLKIEAIGKKNTYARVTIRYK